jgi:outer membrane immunogenic protein
MRHHKGDDMSLNRFYVAALIAISGGGWSYAIAGDQPTGWSGFYSGFNVGYASGGSDPELTYAPDTSSVASSLPALHSSSAIGGVQAGYNWQAGHWLLGGEVDFNWLNAKADGFVQPFLVNDSFTNNMSVSSRYDWLSTARLRAGYLLTPNWLIYATGGLAVTRVEDSATFSYPILPPPSIWSEQRTLFGAAIGGGFEYAFARNWSVKAEYLHAAFNDVLPDWTTPGLVRSSYVKFSHGLDIARIGVNYRWGAPAAMAMVSATPQTSAYGRWAGFYVGLHAGYAWGNSDPYMVANNARGQLDDLFPLPNVRPDGGLGGAQLGYNWQMGKLVAGGEIDISGLNVKDEATMSPVWGKTPNGQGIFSTTYDWMGTARLRMGVVPTPALLVYMTGGLAAAHVTDTATDTTNYFDFVPRTYSATKTLFGGTIGAGLEYALTPRWSVKAEYLYAAFNKTAPQTETSGSQPFVGFVHRLNIARLGINYKFSD